MTTKTNQNNSFEAATFTSYHYTRGDVTFSRLGFLARVAILLTGKISQKHVATFKLTQQVIPAASEIDALNIARRAVIKSDVATDTISEAGQIDRWNRGL